MGGVILVWLLWRQSIIRSKLDTTKSHLAPFLKIQVNIPLVVSSCDRYAVCWSPFAHGVRKYWPEATEQVYFITNQLPAPVGRTLKMGEDQGWAMNLKRALEEIKEPVIIYAQEDYWLKQSVDHAAIESYALLIASGQVDYIRLMPWPPPKRSFPPNPLLGMIHERGFRVSLQMALWRRSYFLELLDMNESPWEFEANANMRSEDSANRFLSVRNVRNGVDYVATALEKGKWKPEVFGYVKREGIDVEFKAFYGSKLHERIVVIISTVFGSVKESVSRKTIRMIYGMLGGPGPLTKKLGRAKESLLNIFNRR